MPENTKKRNGNLFIIAFLAGGDLVAIWLSVLLLTLWADKTLMHVHLRTELLLATVAYIPAWFYIRPYKDINRSTTLDKVFINSMKALVIHALCFMSLAAFLNTDYTISFYLIFYGILFIAFPLVHIACKKIVKSLRRRGYFGTRIAIVGTNNTSRRLAKAMMQDTGFGYQIAGFFDDEMLPDFDGNYIGNLDELERYADEGKIDEIYFTLEGDMAEKMPRVVRIVNDHVLNFYYVPKISHYVKGSFTLHNINSVPVLTLGRNPLSLPWRRWTKRTFDIAFSSVFLVFFPLILIPVAVGIKLSSPGPIFFRQQRTGYKGRSFTCYKFRTMRVNSDSDKVQATADDPRKTRFGDILRKTNLDELPQFINVWLGDMSVVGPRPHMLKHTADYSAVIDKYMVRHVVRPGITGWAQVNGYRGLTDELWKMERRVEFDVWYVENWTFALDLKIVARTIINVIKGDKNAF